MNRKVRQSDIAELSGVSVSTVSRVLNGVPGISADVRDQVSRAATSLGYAVAVPTRSGAMERSVLVVSPLAYLAAQAGQFHIDILQGISGAARDAGVTLTCSPLGQVAEIQAELAGHSGLLLLSADAPEIVAAADAAAVPLGLVNTEVSADTHDVTLPDNRGGSAKAARHLVELGHQDIVLIAHSDRDTINSRVSGFCEATVALLGDSKAPRILRIGFSEPLATFEAALWQAQEDRPFTAVACTNDITALAAIQALNRLNRAVPRDVSVIGFDDLPMASLSNPPLSTIRIDRQGLGAAALRRLLDRMAAPEMPPIRQTISTQLVVRASTAKAEKML
jgi:DNA-binding LacI/PurR family transcriptional regulator